MTEKEQTIVIDDKPNVHAGLTLKQAREEKKLSSSEVASQLRLTRGAIESLENQQWDKLHGRAYARGYFLNYVRFLGLNESQMMAAFDDEYSIEDGQQKLSHVVPETKSFPWLGIIFILVALLITWFAYQHWQTTKTTESNPELIESLPDASVPIEQLDSFDSRVVKPIKPGSIGSDQGASLELNTVDEKQTAQVVENVLTDVEAQTQAVPQQIESSKTDTSDINVTEVSVAEEDQAELSFSAVKDCWVEVTDAQQQILYSDLVKADNTVKVVGTAPVKVVLGNAPDIVVTVNGNQFDTSSFIHGDVARFTVGVES